MSLKGITDHPWRSEVFRAALSIQDALMNQRMRKLEHIDSRNPSEFLRQLAKLMGDLSTGACDPLTDEEKLAYHRKWHPAETKDQVPAGVYVHVRPREKKNAHN